MWKYKECKCASCGHTEMFALEPTFIFCPKCESRSKRIIYHKFPPKKPKGQSCHVDELHKENVRYSWTLGCNEEDLPNMAKKHPGAEFVKREGGGYQMVIHNRQEKKRRMVEAGYEEYG